jgi:hypothetical protein
LDKGMPTVAAVLAAILVFRKSRREIVIAVSCDAERAETIHPS